MSDDVSYSEIRCIVEDARRERIEDDFGFDPNAPEDWPCDGDPALGYCHENAAFLAHRLYDEGYEPYILWGSLGGADTTVPDSVEEAEKLDRIHLWVEVETDEGWLIADIAAETGNPRGGPLVTDELPPEYQRPPGSRILYVPRINSRLLRNLEGYEHLRDLALVEG